MQSQPLVTVKKAASLLGLEKQELRQRLIDGAVKGEQRKVGDKDKWFVYSGELDSLLTEKFSSISGPSQQADSKEREERITLSGIENFFDVMEGSSEDEIETREQFEQLEKGFLPEQNATILDDRPQLEAIESVEAILVDAEHLELRSHASIKSDQVVFEIEDCGITAEGFEEAVQSLSLDFAYRLASERQSLIKLEHQLQEEKALSLKVAPLERALQLEVRSNCMRSVMIEKLQEEVAFLSSQLASDPKPWWKRIFGG